LPLAHNWPIIGVGEGGGVVVKMVANAKSDKDTKEF
jgi:hypothetical protein